MSGRPSGRYTVQNPPVGGIPQPRLANCEHHGADCQRKYRAFARAWRHLDTYRPDFSCRSGIFGEVTRQRAVIGCSALILGYPGPIVASAWGYQLKLEGADDPRLLRFCSNMSKIREVQASAPYRAQPQ